MKVLVLNGPNLGRLGRREPDIYGHTSYNELVELCVDWGRELAYDVEVRQTNHEGLLLDWLNEAADEGTPVVLNAGAWTHYSLALYDACAQLSAPLVEVHLSDPAQRPEEFRHTSVVTPHAKAVVVGQGVDGYRRRSGAVGPLVEEGALAPVTRPVTEAVSLAGSRDGPGGPPRPAAHDDSDRRAPRTRLDRWPTGPPHVPRSPKADPRAWRRPTT